MEIAKALVLIGCGGDDLPWPTAPTTGSAIERAVGSGHDTGLTLRHVPWTGRDDIIGALAAGSEFLDGEPVLVQQGDALLRNRMHAHIAAFARDGLDALALRLYDEARAGEPTDSAYLLSPRAISTLLSGRDRV